MNTDIRLITSFKDHPKRIKLEMILGKEGTSYLIDFWLSTAVNRPDGILSNWDELDISIAAGWRKDPKEFIKALMDCGFLEKRKDTYYVHDWDAHQGWACGATARSAHASHAAKVRWSKKTGESKHEAKPEQCTPDAQAMPEHTLGNAPSPSPNPKPKPIKKSLVAPPPATNDYHAVDYSGIWNEVTGGEISIPKNTATWKKLQLAFGKEKTLAGWRRYCEEIYREGREQYASAANFAKSPKKYMFNKPEQSRWGKLA